MKNLVEVRAELKALENKRVQLENLAIKFQKAEEIDLVVAECIKKYGNDFITAVSNRFQTLNGEQLKRYNLYKKLTEDGFKVVGSRVIGKRGTVYTTNVLTTKLSKETKTTSMTQQEFIKIHNRYTK